VLQICPQIHHLLLLQKIQPGFSFCIKPEILKKSGKKPEEIEGKEDGLRKSLQYNPQAVQISLDKVMKLRY